MEAPGVWSQALQDRADFYLRGGDRYRKDDAFDWHWFTKLPTSRLVDARRRLKRVLRRFGGTWAKGYSLEWLKKNEQKLWETRASLADDVSRRQFDDAILLKIVGYRRFFFPPEALNSLLEVASATPFAHASLPDSYMGARLLNHQVSLAGESAQLITTSRFVDMLNRYRQYLVIRGGMNFAPQSGEVVLDCGACVGDTGVTFALMVGRAGHVHLFDPMPLHVKFCNLQLAQNPLISERMTVVPKAVGKTSNAIEFVDEESHSIRPNAKADESFPFISIDDYVRDTGTRVDVIKMDIEGGEGDALQGAAETIRKYRPKLLISAYHREDDLWRMRELIQSIDPSYKYYFGHHTPVQWESVLYAAPAS